MLIDELCIETCDESKEDTNIDAAYVLCMFSLKEASNPTFVSVEQSGVTALFP